MKLVMVTPKLNLESFEKRAIEVADVLRALANERRLMILCKLVEWGESEREHARRSGRVVPVCPVAASRQDAGRGHRHLSARKPDDLVPDRRSPDRAALRHPLRPLLQAGRRQKAQLNSEYIMDKFTPVSALSGGLLIGASAALFLVLNGRIAGISGILGGLIHPTRSETGWRLAFLAGLFVAPLVHVAFGGALPAVTLNAPLWLLIVAGLIVGFGTRLGAGCTSGTGSAG